MLNIDEQNLVPTGVFGGVKQFFREWSTSRPTYPLGYLTALDGSRGLMALGVMLAHTRMTLFGGAMVYMDMFFTASGYLITSLLILEHSKYGSINLKKFYIRRLRRLYPALIAMLVVVIAVSAVQSSEFLLQLKGVAVAFAYLMDFWLAFGGVGVHYTGHTWSLAVEEQFYLLWPVVFVILIRSYGISWATVSIIFAAAAGFALWRIWLAYDGVPISRLYFSFDTRADALLAGCGLALLLRLVDLAAHPRISSILAGSLFPLAIFMVALVFTTDLGDRWYYYVSPLLGALPALVGIAGLRQPKRTFMHTVYEHPAPVFCGRICYGLYIWHLPVFMVILDNFRPPYITISTFLIGWPITFALAIASYYLIERHFMRTRPL